MDKATKANKVIDIALEKYKPAAVAKVQEEVCASCTDKRCEKGLPCHYFALSVKAEAWGMVPAENN
jgi:hypothetical protein